MLWIVPVAIWAVHGTAVSALDLLIAVGRPLASIVAPAALAYALRLFLGQSLSPLPVLILEIATLFFAYLAVLLFVAGQKELYLDLFRGLKGQASVKQEPFASPVESGSTH
jgi:PST family polysaccharide transporter